MHQVCFFIQQLATNKLKFSCGFFDFDWKLCFQVSLLNFSQNYCETGKIPSLCNVIIFQSFPNLNFNEFCLKFFILPDDKRRHHVLCDSLSIRRCNSETDRSQQVQQHHDPVNDIEKFIIYFRIEHDVARKYVTFDPLTITKSCFCSMTIVLNKTRYPTIDPSRFHFTIL